LPIARDARRLPNRYNPPQIGEHTSEILSKIGLPTNEIEALKRSGNNQDCAEAVLTD
jgi:crotonobetainyl-CoA:carnitine CoA-transferase CaiB-like acyl-CoA transferase